MLKVLLVLESGQALNMRVEMTLLKIRSYKMMELVPRKVLVTNLERNSKQMLPRPMS